MSLHSLGEKMRTPPEKDLTKRYEVEKRTTKSHKPKRIRKINLTILGYQLRTHSSFQHFQQRLLDTLTRYIPTNV